MWPSGYRPPRPGPLRRVVPEEARRFSFLYWRGDVGLRFIVVVSVGERAELCECACVLAEALWCRDDLYVRSVPVGAAPKGSRAHSAACGHRQGRYRNNYQFGQFHRFSPLPNRLCRDRKSTRLNSSHT